MFRDFESIKKYLYLALILIFLLLVIKDFFFPKSLLKEKINSEKMVEQVKTNMVEQKKNQSNDDLLTEKYNETQYPLNQTSNDVFKELSLEEYFFFKNKIDLEKVTREEFISEKKLSNETYSLLEELKQEIFVTEDLFDYENEIDKEAFR